MSYTLFTRHSKIHLQRHTHVVSFQLVQGNDLSFLLSLFSSLDIDCFHLHAFYTCMLIICRGIPVEYEFYK